MAVIDSKKLLPSGRPGGSIVESQKPFLVPVSNILYKKDVNISQKLLKPADKETQGPGGSLLVIKKKVLKIEDVINSTYLIQQSENNRKKKEKERQKAEERERKLETKPGKKVDFDNLPKVSLPGGSILDTIKRFIAFTFAGFLFDKYNQYLPKLLEFGKYIAPVTKFIDAFAKNAVDGVIKFIDLGYKAYDKVNETIKNIGGKDAAKTFDEFSGELNKLLNGAIMASMLIISTAPKAPRGISGGASAGVTGVAKTGIDILERGALSRVNESFGRYIAGEANIGDRARLLRRGFIGGRQALTRGGTEALEKGAARKTAQAVATQATKQSLRSVAAVPIIGALIGFIVDTVVFHEKPTRAAAGAVGSALGQGLGVVLAGGTTFGLGAGVGMFVGGFIGDWLGKALYDTLTSQHQEPTQAKAQGGQVRGAQSGVTPTRKIKTQQAPRPKTYTPPKTQPGRDIGGKLKIEELYGKDEPGKRSALRALSKSSSDLKKMRSLNGVAGGMLGAGVDMALGQKPDRKLANSLGNMFGSVVEAAINAELNSSFNDISKSIAMANGGVVPSREIGSGMNIGERIGTYISNAFSIALESSAAKVLQNLNQELNLKGTDKQEYDSPMGPMGPGGGGEGPEVPNNKVIADANEFRKAFPLPVGTPKSSMQPFELQMRENLMLYQSGIGNDPTVDPVHAQGSSHYSQEAIDIPVNSRANADKVINWWKSKGYAVLDEYDSRGHIHVSWRNPKRKIAPSSVLPTGKELQGEISWYGPGFIGNKTANGETFTGKEMTAAHKTLPFGTLVRVTWQGKSIVVRINDRGPFISGRVLDLSPAAASALGMTGVANGAKIEIVRQKTASSPPTQPAATPKPPKPPKPQLQASIAPTPSSTSSLVASIQQNPSYSQGGNMIVHDVNNIVMPVMVVG